jgi:two-component system response regulator VicR
MKKIVIVDDDQDVLFTTKKVIEYYDNNYKIITLDSGEKLLESLKEDKPDLILLDIMMPDMNGWEVFDKLKSKFKWGGYSYYLYFINS